MKAVEKFGMNDWKKNLAYSFSKGGGATLVVIITLGKYNRANRPTRPKCFKIFLVFGS